MRKISNITRIAFVAALLLSACVSGKERSFTGSTPADREVRSFLGIPASDSVDFIRWQLHLGKNDYSLSCNYGIGKPNTNGFYGGGSRSALSGQYREDEKNLYLEQGNTKLVFAKLNGNLLHVVDASGGMLRGNGGWGYTLNRIGDAEVSGLDAYSAVALSGDSVFFQGRTPCLNPSRGCNKQKWLLVLYPGDSTFFLKGTIVGGDQRPTGTRGSWSTQRTSRGQLLYRLNNLGGGPLYLIMPSADIALFTDADGNLLVGNEDFSFTLSRFD